MKQSFIGTAAEQIGASSIKRLPGLSIWMYEKTAECHSSLKSLVHAPEEQICL